MNTQIQNDSPQNNTQTLDSELARHFNETQAYKDVIAYAKALAPVLLPVMRAERNKTQGEKGGDLRTYVSTAEGLNICQYLESFASARAHGTDYATAICEAVQAMDIAGAGLPPAERDVLHTTFATRDNWFHGVTGQTAPDTLRTTCLHDAQFALLALKTHLRHSGWAEPGFTATIEKMMDDLSLSARQGTAPTPDTPQKTWESETVQKGMAWFATRLLASTALEDTILHNAQTGRLPAPDAAAMLKTNIFYSNLCESILDSCKESLEQGSFVRHFARAALARGEMHGAADPHDALYNYLKEALESHSMGFELSSTGDGPFDPADAPAFLKASACLMQDFAKDFPLRPAGTNAVPVYSTP